ncbi:hypothetical protein [Streptomyces sp. Da 82-17]|uniref:hypothetical protein n=1 Tax=Streptomyces sp. Da 82-17 TaxID=3377116 RepID=UPI0038D483DF
MGAEEERELRASLRDAARAHRPDRERMRARVAHGMTAQAQAQAQVQAQARGRRAPGRPGAPWLRVAGATVAVAAVLAAGGYGVAAAVREDEPRQRTVATRPAPDRTETAELLWADGSIDPGSSSYWSQSNITVKARAPLTALTVEVRLDGRDAPEATGSWRTLPADAFAVTVRATPDGGLLYRWTLKPGRTVPAGEHVFAAQYDHTEGGRDAHGDRYLVRAEARSGGGSGDQRDVWRGDFG